MNFVPQEQDHLWDAFGKQEQLSPHALGQFKAYAQLLEQWRLNINLTTITGTEQIIRYHFQDSLRVANLVDMNTISMIADIGSGAGFPGIPLKIKFPHLAVVLIEVTYKKVQFLELVIKELGLENVTISPLDWRTFLRTTDYPINLFCTRAALAPEELIRMFKPSCPYNAAQLVYWATDDWKAGDAERSYLRQEYAYKVGNKRRKLASFEAAKKGP